MNVFRTTLANVNWDAILQDSVAERSYCKFLMMFKGIYDRCFPKKQIQKHNRYRKPWMYRGLMNMIGKKHKLYSDFLKSRSLHDLINYKRLRNFVNNKIKEAKKNYYAKFFYENNNNPEALWRKINSIMHPINEHQKPCSLLDSVVAQDVAQRFNEYFASVGRSSISANYESFETLLKNTSISQSLFLSPVTESEVSYIFHKLKNSKAADKDGFHIKPVKRVLDLIIVPLVHIYNLCLLNGVFPVNMQIAKVTALYKGGDQNDPGNYRPVSVLPLFSKCLEKVIHSRLLKFFDAHDVLCDFQHGFRSGHSTETALLKQKELIIRNIEANLLTLGIFIDFSKAFDCINHALLLRKLEHYGIRGIALTLIKSYLGNRKQYVRMDNHAESTLSNIYYGVPQGSVLGPLLFIVYINDIVNIDTECQMIAYADDTSIFVSGDILDNVLEKANIILSKLGLWSEANCLQVNSSKTKAVIFRPKNKSVVVTTPLIFRDAEIQIVQSVKCLGVIFSENLSWDLHVNNVEKKLSRVVGLTSRNRYLFPFRIKLLLYNTLFSSHLNYCFLVWGTTGQENLNRLHVMQKKMMRAIVNIGYRDSTDGLFHKYNVLTVFRLYDFKLGCFFKNLHRVRYYVHLEPKTYLYHVRSRNLWKVPRTRTNYGRQALDYLLPVLLNRLDSLEISISLTSIRKLREIIMFAL